MTRTVLPAALLAIMLPPATRAAPPPHVDATFDALAADTRARMLSNPPDAVRLAKRTLTYARSRPSGPDRLLMIATATWLTGEALARTGRGEQAAPYIEAAAQQAAEVAPRSRLLADALLLRGSARAERGRVAEAMSDLHAAHAVFQRLSDGRGRARAFAQIANLYYDANDWRSALKYFNQAADVYDADPGLALAIQNGKGLAFLELRQWGPASAAFARALGSARELNSPLMIATILRNVARVRMASGEFGKADAAIRESIALAQGVAPPEFLRRQIALLAQLSFQRRDLPAARRLVDEAFAGVDLRQTDLADREAHRTAYDTYHALGLNAAALGHLTALKRLDDEATELARSNGAALMAARFDYANQELRIAKLKAEDLNKSVTYERARARAQQLIMVGGTAGALIVVIALAYALIAVRRSRDRVRAANVDLAETNGALGKALAAKTEFLATTSHEIRTPLNGILGMTQVMLADPNVAGPTRDRVSVVYGAGVTMRALVDDILDVAKMETGNLTVEELPFDLRRVLTDASLMWQAQAGAKGLEFLVDLRDCPIRVVGDPARLRQIVFNLLANALKFTAEGSVALTATRAGDRTVITVRDTGIGIAPARHEEIFESFRQADATTTRRFGGTGLGLTICRNLARAMGGDVTVDSQEGEGAAFTVALPLRDSHDMAESSPGGGRLATLVIERNPISRAKLRALVKPVGEGEVEAVGELEVALARLADTRPCRILVDAAALGPAEDALVGLRRLVSASGGARLVVLRHADDALAEALRAAGAGAVLDRPAPRAALLAALNDIPTETADMGSRNPSTFDRATVVTQAV